MQDFDRGFKEVARRAGRALARIAGIECDRWKALVSEVQTTERFADRAFLARRGSERFVVYFEALTRWNRRAPWNAMSKASLLSERELLPTVTTFFILQPRGYQPTGERLRLEVGGQMTQELRFREVRLWEQRPQPWWEDVPGLLPLYPLCDHGLRVREAVLHAAAVIRERVTIQLERANELTLLAIFGVLAQRGLNTVALIGRESMMESPIFREVRQEERLETTRQAILAVLATRFDQPAADSFANTVDQLEDLAQLNRLLRLAASCSNPEEFRTALPTPEVQTRRRR